MRYPPVLRFTFLFLACLLAVAPLRAQQNWRWLNTLPASISWSDAAYGNGIYVVVGGDGTIVTSPDSVQWTVRRSSTSGVTLNGVAFGAGRFVAVGMGSLSKPGAGLILTSTDGVDWTVNEDVIATYSAQFADVVHGNGLWVVSGASQNRMLTSTDGLTWTARNVGSNTGSLVFGDGRFVTLMNNNRALVSTDGVAWTQATLDPAANSYYGALTFGGGRFVALGRDSAFKTHTAISLDGSTWTVSGEIPGSDGSSHSIGHAGTTYVFGGNTELYSSSDGANWTRQTSAMPTTRRSAPNSSGPENIGAITGANGIVFVFGSYGSITTSTDGAAWTRRSSGTAHDINGLVHDGTRFVGVGTGGTVVTSSDGVTWTASPTNFTGWFGKLAYADGRYVATSMAGLRHSTDLATWTTVPEAASGQMWGVIHANGRFVAAGNGIATGLLVSADGAAWTNVKIPGATGSVLGLAGGSGTYVLILGGFGATPKIYSSQNASTWTDTTPANFSITPGSIAHANQRFAILANTIAWSSPDGVNWTSTEINADLPLHVFMGLEDRFVARSNASFASSTDGIAWTLIEDSLAPNITTTAMVEKDGYVFITGGGGAILQGDLAGANGAAPQYPEAGSSTTFTATGTGTVQWVHNGSTLANGSNATLALENIQPAATGIYTAAVTNAGVTSHQSFIVGITTSAKVIGTGTELQPADIVHPNGNIFDQVLLTGPAEAITADYAQNQITRTSYIDLDGDIVQVEFSGPGTLSLVLDNPSGPALPANYNQDVTYMKGHAGIVITGATEQTNVSVFSVGRVTAVNQGLFKDSVAYDGIADIAFIAISSSNGKFGGVRTANAHYFAAKGLTGLYAPGVACGVVYIGDITASASATPVLLVGSSTDARITGGNLDQDNDAAVEVAGLTQLKFTAGGDSHGTELPPLSNAGVLKDNGTDVTSQIVVNP